MILYNNNNNKKYILIIYKFRIIKIAFNLQYLKNKN